MHIMRSSSCVERIQVNNHRLCWVKIDHGLLANPHFKYFSFGNWREHPFDCGISYLLLLTHDVNGALKRAGIAGVVHLFRPLRPAQRRHCEVSAWFRCSNHRWLHQQGLVRLGSMTAAGMPAEMPLESQTWVTKAWATQLHREGGPESLTPRSSCTDLIYNSNIEKEQIKEWHSSLFSLWRVILLF